MDKTFNINNIGDSNSYEVWDSLNRLIKPRLSLIAFDVSEFKIYQPIKTLVLNAYLSYTLD